MKAAIITSYGGPEVLKIEKRNQPTPGAGEVLIRVKAAGINRPDVFQRKGNYPAPQGVVADIPGLEISGVIEELGSKVEDLRLGDEIMALLAGGGYAQYVTVPAQLCLPKPPNLSFIEAASLPETMYTVWHNLFQRAGLQSSDKVLIQGGAGGIGSMAIQLAKLFGAEVYCTVGSDEKGAYVVKLGADLVLNYKKEDFVDALKNKKVTLILDSIGGDYFEKHVQILNEDGRLIQINAMHGAKVNLNLLKLMQKRITVSGSTLRARDLAFKASLSAEIKRYVLPLLESGQLIPTVTKIFDFEQVQQAHEYFDSGEHYGKIILQMES